MPVYLQVILLAATFMAIVILFLYMGGLAVRRTCLKIIAEMEEARAFKESRAVEIQDERKNFFRVGVKNLRPKALHLLIADGLVIERVTWEDYKTRISKEPTFMDCPHADQQMSLGEVVA